ncbi:MAG: carbon monoxide dehydrogenase, partial [Desulfobacca sp.]|nr:carbon monoxide dehydrogenase [Desulfobacca sp.]
MTNDRKKLNIPVIGQSFHRLDAKNKVTGQEKFAVDCYGPDLVWAGVKRAGIPHARLQGIETEAAKRLPGIISVLTYKDVPGSNRQGIIQKDQPVLVDSKARYCGDAVALVLAEDKEVLQKALKKIFLNWEPLPGIFNLEEALKEDAPLVHESYPGGNILLKGEIVKGQEGPDWEDCEDLVEADFVFPLQEHAYLETEAGWAILKDHGFLEIVASTQ